jgi:CO/xanthine dehydrogenase FAD-binding subunit
VSARYQRPATLAEATRLLADGGWRVLAGGTDLYPAHVGRPVESALVDIGGIATLRGIQRSADCTWTFGATTTWTDVLRADLPPRFDALEQAAREIGGVQIQNAGTLAGNLCNASPAADGVVVFMALDAEVVLRSGEGERRVPAVDFVLGNRRTACAPHELVTALELPPASARARSVFLKLGGRRYLTIAVTMVAASVDVDGGGRVVRAGVAVGSCAARAQRLPALELRMRGRALVELGALAVQPDDLAPLAPLDDLRGSADFRREASVTLVERALASLAAGAEAPAHEAVA